MSYLKLKRYFKDEKTKKDVQFTLLLLLILTGAVIFVNIGLRVILNTDTPIVVVEGRSMEPTFYEGDLLIVKGVPPEDIENGSIIVFWAEWSNTLVVHRVIAIVNSSGELYFYTKGDNPETNPVADPYPVPAKDVKGVVIFCIPRIGLITILLNKYGLIIPVSIVLIILIIQTILSSEETPKNKKKSVKSIRKSERTTFIEFLYDITFLSKF
ncbi:MAG: signal peptidase I [Candidatus Asgardarchaeum californiense]|nr:MAG: signal peptidase I [Candidatus Asgardarchaeum californiense]